jgi:DNA-binding response OmpR family regulator
VPKILIADDSKVQLHLLSTYLADKGLTVVTVVDALQAWTAALRERPDAIVLDINMPAGSGNEVLKKLRMSIKTRQIPVVVVTGATEVAVEQTMRDLGAAEFLKKPVDLDQLYAVLVSLMSSEQKA